MEKLAEKRTLTLAGFLITFLGALLFSTKAILVKKAFYATRVDAVTLLTLRMAFSLPFYVATAFFISRRENAIPLTKAQWALTFLLGLFGYYLSSLFDFIGLQYISAGLERLILFLYPTFAVLINLFFFRQMIFKNQWIALLLTYMGIGIAFLGEVQLEAANPQFWWGSFCVFICAVTYAIYLAGSGKIIPRIGSNTFTAYAMLSATLGVFLHYIFTNGSLAPLLNTATLPYGILLAVFATVIPSFLLAHGMKRIGSNNVAIISSIGPVSTILQAHWILNEPILTEQIIGTTLVITGILLLSWKPQKKVLEV
ncbi:MAG TPA: DMT family transporter [Flavisolibacter sp.]|jgi:drug/metabolite transporter (DMT)-like permease|nr:DMT family transporter [Flavisolibacter sp.]